MTTSAETARLAVYNLQAEAQSYRSNQRGYWPAMTAYETALASWRVAYPAEAAAELAETAARHAAARAEKAERLAGGFAARGLD